MIYHIDKTNHAIISGPYSSSDTYVRKITRCGTPELLDLTEYDFAEEVKPQLETYQSYGEPQVTDTHVIFPIINWTQEQIDDFEEQELLNKRLITTCTPRQGLLALEAAGLLDQVEAWINTQEKLVQIDYHRATEWKRTWPVIENARILLGLSEEQIDDLFEQAGQF